MYIIYKNTEVIKLPNNQYLKFFNTFEDKNIGITTLCNVSRSINVSFYISEIRKTKN